MLNYGGNCREALEYYVRHLGGRLDALMTYGEMPGQQSVPANSLNRVLHARMTFGDSVLMACDVPSDRPWEPMRSAYLTLDFPSDEAAEAAHAALAEGGEVFMPMAETFFAHRFSMLRDRFGTNWMLIREKAQHD